MIVGYHNSAKDEETRPFEYPSGRHEIVLRYLPASFLWGAAVSLVSLGLIPLGLIAFSIRSKRKARRATP